MTPEKCSKITRVHLETTMRGAPPMARIPRVELPGAKKVLFPTTSVAVPILRGFLTGYNQIQDDWKLQIYRRVSIMV